MPAAAHVRLFALAAGVAALAPACAGDGKQQRCTQRHGVTPAIPVPGPDVSLAGFRLGARAGEHEARCHELGYAWEPHRDHAICRGPDDLAAAATTPVYAVVGFGELGLARHLEVRFRAAGEEPEQVAWDYRAALIERLDAQLGERRYTAATPHEVRDCATCRPPYRDEWSDGGDLEMQFSPGAGVFTVELHYRHPDAETKVVYGLPVCR